MGLDLPGEVVRAPEEVSAEEAEAEAGWAVIALEPGLAGNASALAAAPGWLIEQEYPAIT